MQATGQSKRGDPWILPATMSHLRALNADPNTAAKFLAAGPGFAAFHDNSIIAAAGVAIIWKGVGEAWVIPTPISLTFPIWLTRTIKSILMDIMNGCKLRRVQAIALVNSPMQQRWLETFGFKQEGIMIAYGPDGEDYYRYAKTR